MPPSTTWPTLAQFKTYIGEGGTSLDAELENRLAAAQEFITAYCGRVFVAPAATTRYFEVRRPYVNTDDRNPARRRRVLTPFAPFSSVSALVNGDGYVFPGPFSGYLITTDSDIPTGVAIGILLPASEPCFTSSLDSSSPAFGRVAITAVWSQYITIPSAVFEACLILAAHMHRSRGGAPVFDKFSPPIDMPPLVYALLLPYRASGVI